MSAYSRDCPPDDCGGCGTLPSGFVRQRYFYGKRLGVIDFVDEQRYHAGKLRFHNQRLHGAGVLCGLSATLFAPNETVLRVGKGAALDACGREIVVGYDQCVDVDAWYARYRAEHLLDDPAWTPPLDGDVLRLCVALRYRECASSPEPAPRDPCACDATGSDFGRVREEFELQLFIHDDAALHDGAPSSPPRAKLDLALAQALGGADLSARVRALLQAGCGEPEGDGWLLLACFDATLDGAREHVSAVAALTSQASMLYASGLLEELLTRELSATLEAGALANGAPEVTGLTFTPGAQDAIQVSLSAPVVKATVDGASFVLRVLDPTGGWQPAPAATVVYSDSPPAITLTLDPLAVALYRLTIVAEPDTPIIDATLRPLRPLRPSFHFQIVDDAGTRALAPAPYAVEAP